MKNKDKIGKLEIVPIRAVFPHEAHHFTVWIEKNIDELCKRSGLQLRVTGREVSLGDLRADLVCEDGHGNIVVIENQLERSDDDHFVRLIQYMGKLKANTAIWITPDPTDKHQDIIQHLNDQSKPGYGYYLVKVEAIRIDNSRPSPLFTVLKRPNEQTLISNSTTEIEANEIEEQLSESPAQQDTVALPPVWCIYPRRDEETYNLFMKENIIGLGFGSLGDLKKLKPTPQAFKDAFTKKWPGNSEAQIRTFYPMFYSLVHRVKTGDIIIYPPTWLERRIHVGIITGDYQYRGGLFKSYRDIRPVNWLISFPREDFTSPALKGIAVNLALFQVRNELILTELKQKLKSYLE